MLFSLYDKLLIKVYEKNEKAAELLCSYLRFENIMEYQSERFFPLYLVLELFPEVLRKKQQFLNFVVSGPLLKLLKSIEKEESFCLYGSGIPMFTVLEINAEKIENIYCYVNLTITTYYILRYIFQKQSEKNDIVLHFTNLFCV